MRDLSGKRIALFVPCYVDQFAPRVAMAARAVLARVGVAAEFPVEQTCCGQPMANMGCHDDAVPLAERFVRVFADYDYVVCPSGSCTAMVRRHYPELTFDASDRSVCERTFELCEFLDGVVGVGSWPGSFEHRVGLHKGCHGLRDLRIGTSSERIGAAGDPVAGLLSNVAGLELVELSRTDECCGFGGTFSLDEPGVSAMMGRDRIADHGQAGAEIIASGDMSCLLHLDGLMRRQHSAMRVMHVAEILAEALV